MSGDLPKQIGPYRILDTLGEGGMAVVYLAEQTEPVKRQVAIKIIKLGMDTKQVTARFESERQALAVLDHPNIAKVFDGGVTDTGRSYFVMERVHGIPITEYCDNARLNTKERIELFLEVCAAVQHAHLKGLVHRDLKPSNILVAATDGQPLVKIIDFGIAKATGTSFTDKTLFTKIGQIIGTPQYMSPEQAGISGLDVDTRSDIYSLGVVLYELLVGALPLELTALGEQAVRLALLEKDPPKPSTRITQLDDTKEEIAKARGTDVRSLRRQLTGDLDWIVLRAMAKDRTRRYETANALAMECRRHLEHQPILARPPSAGYLLRRFVRRNRTSVLAASVAILGIIAGATAATIGFIRATEAERVATREAETARQTADFLVDLFRVSDPSEARGNSITAREILDKGADRIRSELSGEPEIRTMLMSTIGNVYLSIGLYDSAEPLLSDALNLGDSVWGRQTSETAEILFNLAELARLRSNYAHSESLHREVLSIRESSPSLDRPAVANSLHALGLTLYYQGKYDAVAPLYNRALEIYADEFGEESEQVAGIYSSLGSLMHTTNKYDEAEAYFKRSLPIYRKLFGTYHPKIASNLNNLAIVYDEVGQLDAAKSVYEESIAVFRQVYPGDHEFTAETQAHYAGLIQYMGDKEAAEKNYREAIEMLEHTVGREHMLTARVKDSFGIFLFTSGRFDEAEPFIAESIAVHRSLLGDRHINTARVLNNMASSLLLQGKYVDAEPYYRESLSIRLEVLGEDHADVANSRNNLADLLNKLGRYQEAEPLGKAAAEAYAASYSPSHWRAAVARNIHGRSLAGLERFDEAETLILESNSIISEARSGSIYHRLALERTIELYDAWGKPDSSARARSELECLEQGTDC